MSKHAIDFRAWITGGSETRGLDGWWIVTEGRLSGVSLPDDVLAELTLWVESGTFVLGSDTGTIAVNRDVHPATMDVVATRGPNRGRFVPAIFEHARGMLRICYDLSGRQRPRAFDAPLGSRRFLATYRRVAPVRYQGSGIRFQKVSGS
jgi:uncharacterized protein (TIGR03067 family)